MYSENGACDFIVSCHSDRLLGHEKHQCFRSGGYTGRFGDLGNGSADGDSDLHADGHTFADSDADSHSDTDADSNADADGHTHSYTDAGA